MLDSLVDRVGEHQALALGGLFIGLLFGVFAQRSRFCLRSATLEVAHGRLGERLAVWVLVFATALLATQLLIVFDLLDTGAVRQLNNRGSLSGAILGGLCFGCGMTLTRACGSRMLVLSANGNLRALLAGMVFAVVAQMSREGVLAPWREAINEWWTVDSSWRDLLAILHLGHAGAMGFGLCWLLLGLYLAHRNQVPWRVGLAASGVGLVVAGAWAFNYGMSLSAFDSAPVHAISFTSPSADVLMYLLHSPGAPLSFDLGLVPGVFAGSALAGWFGGEFRLEGFGGDGGAGRYIAGGSLMGFGGVLAGGCAVGAGVSGASIFASTAWIVLWSMWIGAVCTDRVLDQGPRYSCTQGRPQ